jgi:hypothetical protein
MHGLSVRLAIVVRLQFRHARIALRARAYPPAS